MPAIARKGMLRGMAALMQISRRRARVALENLSIKDEAQRLASWFSGFDAVALRQIARHGTVAGRSAADRLREDLDRCDPKWHSLSRMLYADTHTWLVDDLLIKG